MPEEVTIDGMDTFRKLLVLGSILCFGLSIGMLLVDPKACEYVDLWPALYAIMAVHGSIFVLTLSYDLGCGWCIRKIRWWLSIYYAILSGTMFYAQMVFFEGKGCGMQAFGLYYWIMFNIVVFYVAISYMFMLWGNYICFAMEREEKIIMESISEN